MLRALTHQELTQLGTVGHTVKIEFFIAERRTDRIGITRIFERVERGQIPRFGLEAFAALRQRLTLLFRLGVRRQPRCLTALQPWLRKVGATLIPEHQIPIEDRAFCLIGEQDLREATDCRAAGPTLREKEGIRLSIDLVCRRNQDHRKTDAR